ncbi:hypothetical protein MUK42_35548, partial [Musa troglodytarum]
MGSPKRRDRRKVEESVGKNSGRVDTKYCVYEFNLKGCSTRNGKGSTLMKEGDAEDISYDANELVLKEGSIPIPENLEGCSHDVGREGTVNMAHMGCFAGFFTFTFTSQLTDRLCALVNWVRVTFTILNIVRSRYYLTFSQILYFFLQFSNNFR